MEKVLNVYHSDYSETFPLICMDEASKQILADLEPALPMSPGSTRKYDHHYQRKDVRALFLFFDPIRGWRRVTSRRSRTREDWAEEIRILVDEDYPDAQRITLVCDNLNTHDIGSLYATFPGSVAGRLAQKIHFVHTPRNGSWLNMAEMELSILSRQCINRRFENAEEMDRAIRAWQAKRNKEKSGANWQFKTKDARIKLKSLYPIPDDI